MIIMPQRLGTPASVGSLFKRAPTPRRNAPRLIDHNHLEAVRELPCLKCGLEPCREAAHVRGNSFAHGSRQAIGRKPSDCSAVPVCRACHQDDADALHRVGEANFWAALKLNPFLIAQALYAASPDLARMRAVVFSFMAGRT